ncbi:Lipoprotein [Sporosarcina sp. ANT_H38]
MLVGGCTAIEDSGPNKESKTELPDTIAAQDEYTRSFLVSTDEVAEGHYVFKPWTEAYTMWIPVDGTLSQGFYVKREKHWERFSYAWLDNEENLTYGLFALFEDQLVWG